MDERHVVCGQLETKMTEVQMNGTWFKLTRGQCSKTRKSLRVHSLHGAQFDRGNVNYWVAVLMLHS